MHFQKSNGRGDVSDGLSSFLIKRHEAVSPVIQALRFFFPVLFVKQLTYKSVLGFPGQAHCLKEASNEFLHKFGFYSSSIIFLRGRMPVT